MLDELKEWHTYFNYFLTLLNYFYLKSICKIIYKLYSFEQRALALKELNRPRHRYLLGVYIVLFTPLRGSGTV